MAESAPAVVFEAIWKKFQRGERHDSLRDLIPALVRRAWRSPDALEAQEFWAIRDMSFLVHPGEALGIVGSNGAGKSTILKLLTKILRPTRGRCRVTGRIGALIEVASSFSGDLTGRENVFLQGAIMGMTRQETARRFDEIVEFAEVGPFIDTPVKRYSNGMNARLGFSIAAHLDPDVLIIDEVLSVGDLAFQEYFVHRHCEPQVRGFRFEGLGQAEPAPGVVEALQSADAVIFCPSNPWVSIDPILKTGRIVNASQKLHQQQPFQCHDRQLDTAVPRHQLLLRLLQQRTPDRMSSKQDIGPLGQLRQRSNRLPHIARESVRLDFGSKTNVGQRSVRRLPIARIDRFAISHSAAAG